MTARWHFTPRRPRDMLREPIQGEFFEDESIDHPGEALIREGIQNSLDACADGETVLVRIRVSRSDGAVSAEGIAPYLVNAWDHLEAEGNGLRAVPQRDEACPFLVFEDFGTIGLTGDTAQCRPLAGVENPFFHFFRAEGRSEKGEDQRGRWGVGKYVFPQASRINAVFGLTLRLDDKQRLLMGQTVLRSHEVEPESYSPDGWFGQAAGEVEPVMPVSDPRTLDDFASTFGLDRADKPGLSLVVPWYDLDMTDEELVKAVARNYFYPILAGELSVIVETPSLPTCLDSQTLLQQVTSIGGDLADLAPLLELAQWARDLSPADYLALEPPPPNRVPKWEADLIPEDVIAQIRKGLDDGTPIAIRVPVHVRKKNRDVEESFFRVFLRRDERVEAKRPVFIRGGITITDVKCRNVHGIASLVVSDDRPLASLLGDAEIPAHTRWQAGAKFKDRYVGGGSCLTFVSRSVQEILRIVSESEEEEDPTLLADIFSLPAEPESGGQTTRSRRARGRHGPDPPPPPPPPPPPKPRRFRVEQISGGFSVLPSAAPSEEPWLLDIRVAYDVRRGNPLKRYNTADFDLGDDSMFALEATGVTIAARERNHVVAKVDHPDFGLHVRGFDEKRDLYIRVTAKECPDASQADQPHQQEEDSAEGHADLPQTDG